MSVTEMESWHAFKEHNNDRINLRPDKTPKASPRNVIKLKAKNLLKLKLNATESKT